LGAARQSTPCGLWSGILCKAPARRTCTLHL